MNQVTTGGPTLYRDVYKLYVCIYIYIVELVEYITKLNQINMIHVFVWDFKTETSIHPLMKKIMFPNNDMDCGYTQFSGTPNYSS